MILTNLIADNTVDNILQNEAERMYIEHAYTGCYCGATLEGFKELAVDKLTHLN